MVRIVKLAHYTIEKFANEILENGFRYSEHSPSSIQWLGNGVYFFDDSDLRTLEIGRNLVFGKREFTKEEKKLRKLVFDLDLNRCNFLDLNTEEGFKLLVDFVEGLIEKQESEGRIDKEYSLNQKFDELLNSFSKRKPFDNEVGFFLGTMINYFINSYYKRIDVISMAFYPRGGKHLIVKSGPYGDIILPPVNQFCLKQLSILPKKIISIQYK